VFVTQKFEFSGLLSDKQHIAQMTGAFFVRQTICGLRCADRAVTKTAFAAPQVGMPQRAAG